PVVPPGQWRGLVRQETPTIVAMALLAGYLDARLELGADPTFEAPEPLPTWAEPWMNGWEVPHYDAPAEARAAALLRMLSRIATIQRRLASPLPQANEIGKLVNTYVEGGDAHQE